MTGIPQGIPRHGSPRTDPNRHLVRQCCMHPLTTKFKWFDAYEFQRARKLSNIGCHLYVWCNKNLLYSPSKARPRVHTSPRPMTNVGKNNVVAIRVDPVLFQVGFHQDEPVFLPTFPNHYSLGTAPPPVSGAAPAAQALTETITPKIAIPAAIGRGKSSSNRTLPTDGLGA